MNLSAVLHLAVQASKNSLAYLVKGVEAPFHTLEVTKRASLSVSEGGQTWGSGGSRLRRERSGTLEGGYDA